MSEKIDGARSIDRILQEKEEKAKKILEDVLKMLKDLIKSSGNIAEIRAKIDMLKELNSNMAGEAEKLLDKLEKMVGMQGGMQLSEADRIKKMQEMVGGMLNGSINVNNLNNDNMGLMNMTQDEKHKDSRIDGSISVAV
ncbi:MAG: hypothetical protein PHV30_09395 [Candidatus Margulisbacteria bacterium]|nr:hypothetical protein [Candidatus Margulisiibacteriota bacterium]